LTYLRGLEVSELEEGDMPMNNAWVCAIAGIKAILALMVYKIIIWLVKLNL
jgi:hypothetical protein